MSLQCFHGSTPKKNTKLGVSNSKKMAERDEMLRPTRNAIQMAFQTSGFMVDHGLEKIQVKRPSHQTKFVEDAGLFSTIARLKGIYSDWDWTISWFFRVSSQLVTTCFKIPGESYWVGFFLQQQFHFSKINTCPAGGSWTCHNTWAVVALVTSWQKHSEPTKQETLLIRD